ncbi:MAG: transcriptional regulator GcvA [Alphaproteobacteria bacterium]|nr:transcriptional regulator GcvA [Alphaproteobacteria bacterium]
MSRWLPSLNAVRAFEAAARRRSFTGAATELNVTQGAVSHQVKLLEDQLGRKLFRRGGRELALTLAGMLALEAASGALDRLAQAFAELRLGGGGKRLTVSVSPNFAAKWLVHRIGRFSAAHPDIDLRIAPSLHHVDFAGEDVDIAVRHGDGNWPDLHVTCLMREELFPVCSPALATGKPPLRRPADLARHTLIHTQDRTGWKTWLDAAGIRGVNLERGPVYLEAALAIDGAIGRQGVALARTALAAHDLRHGRLLRPFGPALKAPYSYWIVCPKAAANRPLVRTFRDWLVEEAARDVSAIEAPDRRKPAVR